MGDVMNIMMPKGARVWPASTLTELWDHAEELGRVSLETSLFGCKYQAEIAFKSPSGSSIYAKGESKEKHEAMELAIREAIKLGASK